MVTICGLIVGVVLALMYVRSENRPGRALWALASVATFAMTLTMLVWPVP